VADVRQSTEGCFFALIQTDNANKIRVLCPGYRCCWFTGN